MHFAFLVDKFTGRWRQLWKYFEGWTTSTKRAFSKQYTFAYYRANQSRVSTRRSPFTTRIKRIAISVYLNSVCYLISCTRLFTKLNLFEVLLHVTFLTTKFSRSTVHCLLYRIAKIWQVSVSFTTQQYVKHSDSYV